MALINYQNIEEVIKLLRQADGIYRFRGLEYQDSGGNWISCDMKYFAKPEWEKLPLTINNPKENDPTP